MVRTSWPPPGPISVQRRDAFPQQRTVPPAEHKALLTLCSAGGTQGPSSYILSYSY